MECPDCARANPLLKDALAQYHIPWVRHDFPLPFHAWSFDAAVYARWFDTKSKKIGDVRDAVFSNQNLIDAAGETSPETPAGPTTAAAAAIHNFAEKFAQVHGPAALPFVVDPQKKLAAEVQADLGKRIGIEHTPTIWVVTSKTTGVPFVEVVDRQRLYQIIDQALAETKGQTAPTHHGAGQ